MKKSVFVLVMLLCLPLLASAAMCGNGVTCISKPTTLDNSNAGTGLVPVTLYTASAGGSGAKITAINSYQRGTADGTHSQFLFYIVHSGTSYPLFGVSVSVTTAMNLMQTWVGATPPTWSTDENGNNYILLAAGDSLAVASVTGIEASGGNGGAYTFTVMGQAY